MNDAVQIFLIILAAYQVHIAVPRLGFCLFIQSDHSLSFHPGYSGPFRYCTLCPIHKHSQNIYPSSILDCE